MAQGAFTVTALKAKYFKYEVVEKAIDKFMDKTGREIKREIEKTVATWRNKPTFEVVKSRERSGSEYYQFTVLVRPKPGNKAARIWGWLDQGTKPHIIRPRGPWPLRFRGGKYTAKTKPEWIGSRDGGPSGDFVRAKQVIHPGIEARHWSYVIAAKRRTDVYVGMALAFSSAIQRARR